MVVPPLITTVVRFSFGNFFSTVAGSVATADMLFRFAVNECGFSMCDTVKMMSENPAKLLGINKGKLDTGYDLDLVVMNKALEVTDVFVGGAKV